MTNNILVFKSPKGKNCEALGEEICSIVVREGCSRGAGEEPSTTNRVEYSRVELWAKRPRWSGQVH